MIEAKELEIVLRYDGSTAEKGHLNLFQASESLEGTARVVNVIVHAFANNGEIRERLSSPEGADTYLSSARKGCFEESIVVEFTDQTVKKIKPSVIVGNFWDFLAACLFSAVGRDYDPSTPMVKRILSKNEMFFEEVAVELENPLQKLHRPIKSKGALTITFARPKSGDVIMLDKESLDYVSNLETESELTYWTGNVTKYNSLNGYGRIYLDQLGKTVPFVIERFKENVIAQRAASASLDERVNNVGGKRRISAFSVLSSTKTIKRIVIQEISLLSIGNG